MKYIALIVSGLCALSSCAAKISEKPMTVIVPSYNNKEWYERNLKSLVSQKYANYHIIYIDDCSSDGTGELVATFIRKHKLHDRVTLIRNQDRRLALENIYHAVYACPDDHIIVLVDGDDWLPDDEVLAKVNAIYTQHDVWMTHGTFKEWPTGWAGWCKPIPRHIVERNEFRTFQCASHLRTFYAWLFKLIKVEDLMYEGAFLKSTWDQAIMFPMIEMAAQHHYFIEDIVYIYNIQNPINDNKVDSKLQLKCEQIMRSRKPYQSLKRKP